VSEKRPPLPRRPFRDSAIFYAVITLVFILLVFATGGDMSVAIPVALACFVVATGYAWWKFKQRLEQEQEEEQEAA
jgi:nicotinamide riboside transporter PnuC